jgi:hypothetical protein
VTIVFHGATLARAVENRPHSWSFALYERPRFACFRCAADPFAAVPMIANGALDRYRSGNVCAPDRHLRGGPTTLVSPSLRLQTVCIDCADAHVMADFYGRLLGWDVSISEPQWVLMRDPAGGMNLSFQADARYREPTWPEQDHRQDKMLHLDIKVDDLDAAVDHGEIAA